MRIGLIGLGRIGAFHAETLSALSSVTSLVVTDAVPAAIDSVVERYGVESAETPEKLLASGVDGVVVAAATDAHPELIVAAAEAGVPVFCEKPVAKTMAEGVAVARRIAGTGVPVQIGYPRRFDAGFAAVRQAIANGELGWVHTVRSTTLDPAPPPPAYLAVSGGIFRDCSIHDFDAVRWVTGREVVEVYATGSDRGDPVFADIGDVAFAATVLTLDDGARALVSNSRYNARGHDVRMEVHGSDDAVAAGLDDKLPLRSAQPGVTFPGGKPYVFFMDRFADAFRASLAAFTEVVAGARPSPCTIEDALETGWVAEAAALSLAEHRPVRIDEVREPRS
jgi:myo-inositol 2-dehydrogenase / D-chiro-inositol 1-dehydrogenase